MRIVARIVFFLVAAFGVVIGVIYPLAASNQSGDVIGTWRVFDASTGFAEVEVTPPREGEFILARMDIGTARAVDASGDTVLGMTVTSNGWTISAQTFTLENAARRDGPPQNPAPSYTVDSDPIYLTGGDEPYLFAFEHGRAELPLAFVDMTLVGNLFEVDEAVPPIGWGLMAIGVLGMAFTRKRRDKTPPAQKWGRG